MPLMKSFFCAAAITALCVFCSPPPDLPVREETADGLTIRGDYTKEDTAFFLDFRRIIQEAMREKSVDKAFAFYSDSFMSDTGLRLEEMKKNTRLLYRVYRDILYGVSDYSVSISKDTALSKDRFTFRAVPVNPAYKPLDQGGRERIYWQKENGQWKIVNWVYE